MGKIKNLLSWFFARKSRLLISVVLILLVGFIVVRNRKSDTTNEYQTATAQKGTIVSTVSASGKVLTTNTLSISPKPQV